MGKEQTKTIEAAARELVTAKEARALPFMQVGRSTLWRWERAGLLKPVGIGRKKYYLKTDLINIAAGRKPCK